MQFICGLAIGGAVIAAFAALLHDYPNLDPRNAWLVIIAPSLSGVFIAFLVNALNAQREKKTREEEFQKYRLAILHELSNRVAACVIDYHLPWKGYGHINNKTNRSLKAVYKFKIPDPVIYPSAGSTLGKMRPNTVKAIIHFYNSFFRWKREIVDAEYSAKRKDKNGHDVYYVNSSDLRRMSRRLGETIEPGLAALKAMCGEIGSTEAETIIAQHFEAHYAYLTTQDPRYDLVGNIKPFSLMASLADEARNQKEEEMKPVNHY